MITNAEIQDKLKFDLHIEHQEIISLAITKGSYMVTSQYILAKECQFEINKHQRNILEIIQKMLDLKAENTLKNKVSDLRKRNPYKPVVGTYFLSLGWEDACDELEKMQNE